VSLDFSGLEQLTDAVFGTFKFFVSNLGKLQNLKCNGCRFLTDTGKLLAVIKKNTFALRHLLLGIGLKGPTPYRILMGKPVAYIRPSICKSVCTYVYLSIRIPPLPSPPDLGL
jgi:hypothetical protein